MAVQVKPDQAFAYAELLEILSLTEENDVKKIPQKLISIFKSYALPTYENHLNPNIPLKDQNISEKTAALLALLSLNYWCESKEQKEELQKIYDENERKYQEELNKKYSYENIFNNEQAEHKVAQNLTSQDTVSTNTIKVEEINTNNLPIDYNTFPWYKKMFTKIKNFFYKLLKKANNPT